MAVWPLALGHLLACAPDDDGLPVVARGRYVEIATVRDEPVCGGTAAYMDRVIEAVFEVMNETPPDQPFVRFEWLELDEADPTIGGAVTGVSAHGVLIRSDVDLVHEHELVHAVQRVAWPRTNGFLIEGHAVLLDAKRVWANNFPWPASASLDDLIGARNIEASDYGLAWFVVSQIVLDHGFDGLRDFWHAVPRGSSAAEVRAAYEGLFGRSMDALIEPYFEDFGPGGVLEIEREPCFFALCPATTPEQLVDGRWSGAGPSDCEQDPLAIGPDRRQYLYEHGEVWRDYTLTLDSPGPYDDFTPAAVRSRARARVPPRGRQRMSPPPPRHQLPEALAAAREFCGPHRVVELLAAYGAADDAARASTLGDATRTCLAGVQLDATDVTEDFAILAAKIDAVPDDPHELDRWLLDLETVGLAMRGCDALGDVVPEPLRRALGSIATAMDTAGPSWRERVWDCPLVATDANAASSIRPWTFVRSRTAQGQLTAQSVDTAALAAWLDRTLHPDDATTLRTLVAADGPWQQAYRDAIQREANAIYVPQRAVECTTTAAASASELGWATRVLIVPTPHRGDGVVYEMWLGQSSDHQLGVLGRFDDQPAAQAAFTPATAAAAAWSDEVLGTIQSTICLLDTTTLEILRDIASSIEGLASGELHPRAQPIARAAADDLQTGLGHHALAEAARVFESGDDGTPDDGPCAAAVLRTRVALELVADRLQDAALDDAVRRADAAIDVHGKGLLLLEDEMYAEILGSEEPNADAWWGRPRVLAARVPFRSLLTKSESAAGPAPSSPVRYMGAGSAMPPRTATHVAERTPRYLSLAADSSGPITALSALERAVDREAPSFAFAHREVIRAFESTAGLWRYPEIARQLDQLTPTDPTRRATLQSLSSLCELQVGTVLIPAVDRGTGIGVVVEARVRVGPDQGPTRFGPIAHLAFTRAYAAVASLCPRGPRDALEDLAIELVGPVESLEGASLTLPLAIAIASLWLGKPVPSDLSATGDLEANTDDIASVDGISAKAAALARFPGDTRLLCHAEQADAFDESKVVALPVERLADALQIAGLALDAASFEPCWGSVHDRLVKLDLLTKCVDAQDLRGFGTADPWLAIAERMRLLISSLSGSDADEIGAARTRCALAYIHASKPARAVEILAPVNAETDAPEIAITRLVVELGAAIDRPDPDLCVALSASIDAALVQLPMRARKLVLGIARGTQGRALRHLGDALGSLPLLLEARDFHAEHRAHELARSRFELAASLRAADRPGDALAELELARRDLHRTREYSRPYADATAVYVEYESARCFVDLGAGLEAFKAATQALEACPPGFWPRLGILRTLTWAHRLLGDTRSADACVDQMRRLDATKAPALVARLIGEAEGPPRMHGEAY